MWVGGEVFVGESRLGFFLGSSNQVMGWFFAGSALGWIGQWTGGRRPGVSSGLGLVMREDIGSDRFLSGAPGETTGRRMDMFVCGMFMFITMLRHTRQLLIVTEIMVMVVVIFFLTT